MPSDQITVPLVQTAVKVVVSGPHNTNLPGVTVGATGGTPVPITIVFDTPDTPQVLTQVAVYVPAPTETGLPVPTTDGLHVRIPPLGHVPVKVALPVPQTLVVFVAITGAIGEGVVVIVTGVDDGESPHSFLQTAL